MTDQNSKVQQAEDEMDDVIKKRIYGIQNYKFNQKTTLTKSSVAFF